MNGLPKRIVVILAVSAALNLFFLGLIAARFIGPGRGFMMRDDAGERGFMRRTGLHSAGPKAQDVIRQYRETVRDSVRSLSGARAEVKAALQAEPYDPARVDKAFAEVRAKTSAMQLDIHVALANVSRELTPAQRERLANSLWRKRSAPVP